MIVSIMGTPAFVRRLILFDQTLKVIKWIHQNNEFIFFTQGQIKHNSKCTGRIMEVMKFLLVTILFLMRYLNIFISRTIQHIYLKITSRQKKIQKLKFKDPETEETVIAKWSDLIHTCQLENDSFFKLTKLNYATFIQVTLRNRKL